MVAEGVRVSLTEQFAPTPAFSYAVVRLRAAGAVVITASHNPAQYSGIKFKAAFGGSAPVSFTRGVEEEIGGSGPRAGTDQRAAGSQAASRERETSREPGDSAIRIRNPQSIPSMPGSPGSTVWSSSSMSRGSGGAGSGWCWM